MNTYHPCILEELSRQSKASDCIYQQQCNPGDYGYCDAVPELKWCSISFQFCFYPDCLLPRIKRLNDDKAYTSSHRPVQLSLFD